MTETLTDRLAITYRSLVWYDLRSIRVFTEYMSTPESKRKKRAMLRRLYNHYDRRFRRDCERYLELCRKRDAGRGTT